MPEVVEVQVNEHRVLGLDDGKRLQRGRQWGPLLEDQSPGLAVLSINVHALRFRAMARTLIAERISAQETAEPVDSIYDDTFGFELTGVGLNR